MSHSSATKLNRFRLQYSLRSLLVFVLLASVFMAWFGARYRAAREQRDAVAAIRARRHALYDYERQEDPASRPGPYIAGPAEPPGPAWARGCWGSTSSPTPPSSVYRPDRSARRAKWAPQCHPGDCHLRTPRSELLRRLAHPRAPQPGRTQMTGNGLEKLGVLRRLRELSLYKTATSDAGLDGVGRLTRLEVFDLSCCRITDAGLERLTGLVELRSLNLQRSRVTAEGVRKLQARYRSARLLATPRRQRRAGGERRGMKTGHH